MPRAGRKRDATSDPRRDTEEPIRRPVARPIPFERAAR